MKLKQQLAQMQEDLDDKRTTINEMNAELKKASKYQAFYHQRKQKKYRNCGSQVSIDADEQGSQCEANEAGPEDIPEAPQTPTATALNQPSTTEK